jgi:hypothetical protein
MRLSYIMFSFNLGPIASGCAAIQQRWSAVIWLLKF